MNQRTLLGRLLSPAGFGLVLLLFLLPFATVSCSAESEHINATFTGLDFVIGGEPTITGTNVDEDVAPELAATFIDFYDAEPLAIIAAVLLLAGMAAALIRQRKPRALVSATIAAVVVVLLAVAIFIRAPSKVNEAMEWVRAQAGLDRPIDASTSPTVGFWLAIVLLVALAAWQGFEAARADGHADGHADGAGPPPAPPDGSDVQPVEVSAAEIQESWRAPES